jgi:hypothetical protein
MRLPAFAFWGPALLAALLASCRQAGGDREARAGKEPLLLLSDDGKSAAGPGADNSRCHVCHLNYIDEKLAVGHARGGIGCAKCHGPSDAHIADESWSSGGNGTAPDLMYPREKINPFCWDCHPKNKIDLAQHKEFLAGKSKEAHCTDCHGEHRLHERKCRWK